MLRVEPAELPQILHDLQQRLQTLQYEQWSQWDDRQRQEPFQPPDWLGGPWRPDVLECDQCYQVTLSGYGENEGCGGDCSALNGTHILRPTDGCNWLSCYIPIDECDGETTFPRYARVVMRYRPTQPEPADRLEVYIICDSPDTCGTPGLWNRGVAASDDTIFPLPVTLDWVGSSGSGCIPSPTHSITVTRATCPEEECPTPSGSGSTGSGSTGSGSTGSGSTGSGSTGSGSTGSGSTGSGSTGSGSTGSGSTGSGSTGSGSTGSGSTGSGSTGSGSTGSGSTGSGSTGSSGSGACEDCPTANATTWLFSLGVGNLGEHDDCPGCDCDEYKTLGLSLAPAACNEWATAPSPCACGGGPTPNFQIRMVYSPIGNITVVQGLFGEVPQWEFSASGCPYDGMVLSKIYDTGKCDNIPATADLFE